MYMTRDKNIPTIKWGTNVLQGSLGKITTLRNHFPVKLDPITLNRQPEKLNPNPDKGHPNSYT